MYVLHVNPITSSSWDGSQIPTDAYASGVLSHNGGEYGESKPVSRVPSKTAGDV